REPPGTPLRAGSRGLLRWGGMPDASAALAGCRAPLLEPPHGVGQDRPPGRGTVPTWEVPMPVPTCTLIPPALEQLREQFLARLPRIELHARIPFREVRCPGPRADAAAETVALAWKWQVRLAERGKDATRFPAAFATLAARAVRCGRRLCGHERAKEVLSPV